MLFCVNNDTLTSSISFPSHLSLHGSEPFMELSKTLSNLIYLTHNQAAYRRMYTVAIDMMVHYAIYTQCS